jgi:hypothetical protein
VGLALLMAPLMASALNAVPHNKAGMASSMLNIIQQVGGSIGIALLATIFSNRTHFHLGALGAAARAGTPAFMETFRRVAIHAHSLGYSYAESRQVAGGLIIKNLVKQAIIMSFQDAFIVAGFIVASAIVFVMFLPNRSLAHTHDRKAGKGEPDEVVVGLE